MQHPELSRRLRRTLQHSRVEAQVIPEGFRLFMLNADFPDGPLSGTEQRAVMDQPAYWAICWPAGRVLASLFGEHPEWVEGRRVLDLGCGGGVAALAAARAGARVLAVDHDPDARAATRANALLNGLKLEVSDQVTGHFDLVLLADVLYDPENQSLLKTVSGWADEVLVADCRLPDAPPGYRRLGVWPGGPLPELPGWCDFDQVFVYRRVC